MSTYQHRISFKGSEDSIDHFTKLLRDAKDIFGVNSAEILMSAISHWLTRPLASHLPRCNAQTRAGCSRIFYLQVLTTAFVVSRLNTELEKLRRDPTLKMMLEPHRIGRQEFLLEGLIIVLEFYRSSDPAPSLKKAQPMDVESDKKHSGALPTLYNNKSSCFGLNLERNRKQETEIEIPTPHISWRQKLIEQQNAESASRGPITRYNGASKSTHSLHLNGADYENNSINKNLIKPELSTRCTSVEYLDRARCRSTDLEPENRHLTSWRQRLREQQLAENRRLTDSIRSRSSVSRMGSEERSEPRQSPNPTGHTNCVLSCKHTEQLDNKNYIWRPVHESAIEAAQRASVNSNYESRTQRKPPLPPSTPKLDRNNNNNNNNNNYITQENDNSWRSTTPTHYRSAFLREASEPISSPILTRRKIETETIPIQPKCLNIIKSSLRQKHENLIGNSFQGQILTLKDRNSRCNYLSQYLIISTPDIRPVPGFDHHLTNFQRVQEGVDCDEVFPGIILGNGATLRRKDYLNRIGITHILNAAENHGVNIGKEYFGGAFYYMGLKIEDTPQTQICRHFLDVAEYIDGALLNGGKVFVNCVFGISRSTTCIIAYLMIAHGWDALRALEHVRRKRPVKINSGFLQQIADLENQLQWNPYKLNHGEIPSHQTFQHVQHAY